MVLTLDPDLGSALTEQARKRGVAPETLALASLRRQFLSDPSLQPQDDWERELLAIGRDCGVSLSNEAVSSEGIYD